MPSLEVTSEYRLAFVKAEQTFLYQLVYDPKQRKLIPLTPYPPNLDPITLPFAGKYMEDDVAFQLAIGNLDAETLERLDSYNPDAVVAKRSASFLSKHVSIWSKNFVVSQDNSSTADSKSANAIAIVCKQTTAKVAFSLPKTADQVPVISDNELTTQYAKKESPTSPILTARKRRRIDENCSPLQNQNSWSSESTHRSDLDVDGDKSSTGVPSILDPFAEPLPVPIDVEKNVTPSRKTNPFVKLKTPSNDLTSPKTSPASHFSALQTYSQLRKVDSNGKEIVTSAYFHSEKITEQLKKSIIGCDNQTMVVSSTQAALSQPFKPVSTGTKSTSPTEVQQHLVNSLFVN